MYKRIKPKSTFINVNKSFTGETIETKINRIVNNKEPIKDNAPINYTARKDGVMPQYDIRTDRFELAVDAMDYVTKSHLAKREAADKARMGKDAIEGIKKEGGETPSIQATTN